MTPEDIAKVCHEVNRGLCIALGDFTQPRWEAAPDWQKRSAVDGVMFHMWNPQAKASESHEHWLSNKLEEGWVRGPAKDQIAKTHPCMVPYEDLPITQKLKDHQFKTVVNVLSV